MNKTIKTMLKGFAKYPDYVLERHYSPEQEQKIQTICQSIQSFKDFYQQSGKYWYTPEEIDYSQFKNMPMKVRGRENQNKPGFYLSKSEVDEFEEHGVLGPYPLLSPSEAHDIKELAYEMIKQDCYGKYVFSDKIIDTYRSAGQWNLNGVVYPALYEKALWDLLIRDEIAQRVSCLLGNNIICWAQKFFEKQPKQDGTFWHQATTFQENSAKPKLYPTTDITPNIIQATVWIALTDSTIKNGCLRFMPGSFHDIRFDYFFYHFKKNTPYFLMNKSKEDLENYVRAFVAGIFPEGYALFNELIHYFDDIFIDYDVVDYEVKAGDFIIFTSSNMHASYPNLSDDDTRLAFAGRYTNNDVRTFCNDQNKYNYVHTPLGPMKESLEKIGCFQVHGEDTTGFNRIFDYPW